MSSFIKVMDDTAKALVFNRFKGYLEISNSNLDMVQAPREVAQRKIAEKRGESSVEFISIWRNGIELDWERQNTVAARRGVQLEYDDSDLKTNIITAKAIPVKMNYDVHIWSRNLDKTAQVIESYLNWLHDTPQVILNYLNRYPLEMYLKFGAVDDQTDYNIYEKGLYFVTRLPLTLDGQIFTVFDTRTILTIILDVFLREGTAPNYVDTLLNEYTITATP